MSRRFFWPTVIIISAILTAILAGSNSGFVLRPILLFWFMLIIPGMAIIRLLHIEDRLAEMVLAVALSLVISTLFAEIMVLTRLWSPSVGLAVLVSISLIGAVLQIKDAVQN